MEETKNIAMKIFHAYEDSYLDKEKRKLFETLFDTYLSRVDHSGTMEVYDAVIALAQQYPNDFDDMLRRMKESALFPET